MQTNMDLDLSSSGNATEFISNLSLYLPSINSTITFEHLKDIFTKNKIGVVSRVDFVYNTKGVRQAFVHFSMWFDSEYTRTLQNKILDTKLTALLPVDNTNVSIFGKTNIILLQNRNPRDEANNDLINSLQMRIQQLETKFTELFNKDEILNQGKRSRYDN
jgi:hypothetical protein